jgi:1,2-diacylglycerol 3-alpha-glucosyltransferase
MPLKVIPTGIDLDRFTKISWTKEERAKFRVSLGIKSDESMLLVLSRLSYEKNIQALINGMPRVLAANPQAHLVIVGDGPYRFNLEQQVQKLNLKKWVHFSGMVSHEQTKYFYHAADYFVNASTSETQGLTYLEALASQTPCIVQGNEYLEQIFDQEIFGKLFYGDDRFADTLISYLKQPKINNPQAWQEKKSDISAEKFGISMANFYSEVVNQRDNNLHQKTRGKQLKLFTRILR